MQPVILDTDVFSFFFKGDSRARLYDADMAGKQLCLCGDAWIAAAAIRHSVPLLTHNASDFAHLPTLQVVSHA